MLLSLLFLSLSALAAQEPSKTVSIDSGYVPSLATNYSMKNLWLEYEGLGSGIFDLADRTFLGSNFLTRALLGTGMYFGWHFMNHPLFVANHELGHGTRAIALGLSPKYNWDGGGANTSILTFILQGYVHYNDSAETNSYGNVQYLPSNWSIVSDAGGMNNSMMFAETLEDETYYSVGHITQADSYIRGKLDVYNYARFTQPGRASDDVQNLTGLWSGRGYSISTNDLKVGGMVALLASSTTYIYAISILSYLASGDSSVRARSLGPFKLPDVSFYQNRDGISYRLRSAMDMGGYFIPLSVEYLYKGSPQLEVSLGYRQLSPIGGIRKAGLSVQGYLSTSGGFGARAIHDFALGQSTYFTLGASFFSVNSLEGERNLGHLISNSFGVDGWGRFSWAI